MNKYLSKTVVSLPPCSQVPDKCKEGVTVSLPAGVQCTHVSFSKEGIVDNIPSESVTSKWFTINALQVGSVDITFTFSDGIVEVIHTDVVSPSTPTVMQVTVPVNVTTVTLIIER